ncbi:hypothetical protein HMPREF9431_01372 [Segatella oulorum F0390]|uniref:Fimbrillin family protein n=1 Tax=Segatella oulorum F0390 TaxID=702438 RepID=G1WC21_9BACT|nr:hypothetical protein [Segatella oulorum]EGV31191.1 hypothetical protein HMPREF9431_01372 [Segatella oulorum F0390]
MKIKNKLSNLAWSRLRNRGLLVAVGAAALLAAACADDDLATDKPNKHMGTTLAFNVSDVQMDALAQNATEQTRGLSMQPIPASYLAPRKIEATGSNPHDFCLIESTVEGLNPVKVDAKTRGTILTASTLGTFSSIGYRAASAAAASNPSTALLWFHNEKTNPDGTLVNRYDWDWPVNVYGRFYAVSPEATAANGITFSPSNYAQVPYVDFEVKSNVIDQVDLMTACSGEVHYEHGNDPTSNLKFTHALAAVKFSIGSNLSPVIIKKIEVSGVKYKGRYKLPNKADGSDAAWLSVDNATTTVTLDGINVNAAEMPNTMLAGALNPATNPNNRPGRQNYTFLMIPQTLPAKGAANHAKVTIYYQDGPTTKHVSFPLTGEWKANTTQEYKLSQRNSTWEIRLSVAGTSKTFDYQGNLLMGGHTFDVTSYRQSPDGTIQQAVPWKISKYEEWDYTLNGGTGGWVDRGTTKPDWLGDLTDHGNGGTAAEAGNTAVKPATIIDKLAAYNQVLKDATPKGTATNPYNLANPSGNGARNFIEESANCYLISAPGHYCIPLVYGNSIKNNQRNTKAYQSSQPAGTPYLLKTFKEHRNIDIVNPWIGQQQGGGPDDAKIVWMDQPNLVRSSSLQIVHNPDYLEFEVKKEDIRNGNAVIAVTRGGEVAWSWHLWFDHADALNKITCKNYDGIIYKFTRNTLGQVYFKYEATSYDKPRKACITIEQQAANGGVRASAPVVITQNPENKKEIATTLYQFGRKDALPGTDAIAQGSYSFDNTPGGRSIGYAIQHPEKMFRSAETGMFNNYDWCNATYYNLWSIENTTTGYNDNAVVKTIYDPCPAGFKMPASNAFTGFTTTGNNTGTPSQFNINGGWDYGWNFNNRITSPDATVYFPALGFRNSVNGSLISVGIFGGSWSAVPADTDHGCGLHFYSWEVYQKSSESRAYAHSVRPVADTKTKVTPKLPGSTEEQWGSEQQVGGTEIDLDN